MFRGLASSDRIKARYDELSFFYFADKFSAIRSKDDRLLIESLDNCTTFSLERDGSLVEVWNIWKPVGDENYPDFCSR